MGYANPPFQHVYLVNHKLELHNPEEFVEAEKQFGVTFPPLHKAFLQMIGTGAYCDHIRIHNPQEIIENNQKRWRNENTPPNNGSIALSYEHIQASIMVADSIDGDQIVFLPDDPEKLYVLLRGYAYGKACLVPRGFLDLMLWVDAEGQLESATAFPYFTSWKDRREQWFQAITKPIMLADVTRHIEQSVNVQIKMQVSQRYEEGTSTICFLPAIHGSLTFNENTIYNAQDVETSCNIEYDIDFEDLAGEIIQSIRDVGFQ